MKYVYLNEKGEFLILGERQSFAPGGRSPTMSYTRNLDEASVLHYLPKGVDLSRLTKIPAREERRVFLEAPTNDHQ